MAGVVGLAVTSYCALFGICKRLASFLCPIVCAHSISLLEGTRPDGLIGKLWDSRRPRGTSAVDAMKRGRGFFTGLVKAVG